MVLNIPVSSGWKPVLKVTPVPAATEPAPRPVFADGSRIENTVLVLGSYRKMISARRVAGSWKRLRPVVVAANVEGKTYFRVVTGPFPRAAITGRRNALKAEGLRGVWAARLCAPGRVKPGCIALFPRS